MNRIVKHSMIISKSVKPEELRRVGHLLPKAIKKQQQLNWNKNNHIDIDFLGSQDEKLTEKDLAEISEQIKLIRAALMIG